MPRKPRDKKTTPTRTAGYKSPNQGPWGQTIRDLPIFTFQTIRAMLWDPTIRLGLAMRAAPLCNAEFAYKEPGADKWTPGIKCDHPAAKEWIERQLARIWQHYLPELLKSQIWGWAGGEVTWKFSERRRQWDVNEVLPRHAQDIRALERDGCLAGVQVRRVTNSNGPVNLERPYCLWHAFSPEAGDHYSHGILKGAYSPWADKWLDGMALDVRRLFMHKDAYGGAEGSYPPGFTEVAQQDGSTLSVPNQDIMQQMLEVRKAGGVVCRPSAYDANGKEMWTWKEATVAASPTHILEYPKDLDVEMLRGMEVPDDVLTSEETGAWAGKQVPQNAFYTGLDTWGTRLVGDLDRDVIKAGVVRHFGEVEYELKLKPLAEQAAEKSGEKQKDQGGGGGSFNPFMPQYDRMPNAQPQQMSLDPVAAVGEGVLNAAELVTAAKQAIRMANDDRGQWITIGAQKAANGEKKGGVPVKIDRGKIVAGPAKFVGRRIKEIAEKRKPDSRFHEAMRKGAEEWRVNKRDLREAIDHVWSEKRQGIEEREQAKAKLRKYMGLTQQDASRLENSGKDYTAIKDFDTKAREVAGELAELGIGGGYEGGTNFDDTDAAAMVWELLKEGRIDPPAKHDPALIDEAANLVIDSRKHKANSDAEYVPFSLNRQNGLNGHA